MRLVQFDLAFQSGTQKIQYPDDVSFFRNTQVVGTKVVGEYSGSDETIPDYTGEWPIRDKRRVLTKREFLSQFTPAEHRAIKDATATDDDLNQLWDIVMAAPEVDLDFQQTVDGMAYLVSASLITQARHDEIMEGV